MQDRDQGRPLTKRQRTTLERRKQIVEAAATCFIKQGFHQTSIRDIAKQAGVSVGNLYNHFEAKTDLITEIATLEADDLGALHAMLMQEGPLQMILDRFAAAYFAYVSSPENAVLSAEIKAEIMRSPEIAIPFLKNRNKTVALLEARISKADPAFLESPTEMAETILSLIESSAARTAFASKSRQGQTLSTVQSILRRLLNS